MKIHVFVSFAAKPRHMLMPKVFGGKISQCFELVNPVEIGHLLWYFKYHRFQAIDSNIASACKGPLSHLL